MSSEQTPLSEREPDIQRFIGISTSESNIEEENPSGDATCQSERSTLPRKAQHEKCDEYINTFSEKKEPGVETQKDQGLLDKVLNDLQRFPLKSSENVEKRLIYPPGPNNPAQALMRIRDEFYLEHPTQMKVSPNESLHGFSFRNEKSKNTTEAIQTQFLGVVGLKTASSLKSATSLDSIAESEEDEEEESIVQKKKEDQVRSSTSSLPKIGDISTKLKPAKIDTTVEIVSPIRSFPLPQNYADVGLHLSQKNFKQHPLSLSTDAEGIILLASEQFCSFVQKSHEDIVGHAIQDFLTENFKNVMNQDLKDGLVLKCGEIICFAVNSISVPVSAWIKVYQRHESNQISLNWVLNEIEELSMEVHVDEKGIITAYEGDLLEMFQLNSAHNIQLSDLIPVAKQMPLDELPKRKYLTGKTTTGHNFPVILLAMNKPNIQNRSRQFQVISLTHISGLLICSEEGSIVSGNYSFLKYLFGYSVELQNATPINISSLIPHFSDIKNQLHISTSPVKTFFSQDACRSVFTSPVSTPATSNSLSDSGKPEKFIKSIHKYGANLYVDVQMRKVGVNDVLALWISFDRDASPRDPSPRNSEKITINAAENEPKDGFDKPKEKDPGVSFAPQIQSNTDKVQKVPCIQSTRKIGDYAKVSKLGEGAFGSVYLAKHKIEQTPVVIKFIIKRKILIDCWTKDEEMGVIPLELQILRHLQKHTHPNITHVLNIFDDSTFFYLEMKLHGKGMDLFDYIERNLNMSELEIRYIFKQTCQAIQHLHHLNIVHRDIKDENIIIDEQSNIQLIDFGSAAWVRPEKPFVTFYGTLDYCSPEVLVGQKYTGPPQDIWALGILLYTLIYKENPFYNPDEILKRDLRVPFMLTDGGSLDLIRRMLNRNENARFTIDQVLEHRWLHDGK